MINPSGSEDINNIIKTCTEDFSEAGFRNMEDLVRESRYSVNVYGLQILPLQKIFWSEQVLHTGIEN